MQKYKCLRCEHVGTNGSECVQCGRTCLVLFEERQTVPKAKPKARNLATVPPREFVKIKSTLAAVLGGKVPKHGLVLVTGPAGAGKSTLVAELALELKRQSAKLVVLDAEMGDELAVDLWMRGGATRRELAELVRYTDEDLDWESAVNAARHADVIIVDSINEWSEAASLQEVLKTIRRNGPLAKTTLIFAIAHFAREGHLFGTVKQDHRGDALVIVEPDRISQTKCTWAPRTEVAR